MQNKKSSIGKNAAILGVAGLIVKILGAVYRIPITAMIKDEGIGYFQAAYPIYEMMLAISTAGLPVAVATIVSRSVAKKEYKNSKKTFSVAFWFMTALGGLLALLLFLFAKPLVRFLGNEGSYIAMLTLVPAMIFSPMLAAMRGYYQGLEIMTPTAISQILVQGFRVVFGLYLCYLFLPYGLKEAAGGASAGAGLGALIGVIYMGYVHLKNRNKLYENDTLEYRIRSSKDILVELIKIAIPISIGAAILPIMDTIDIRLVMKGLSAAGFSEFEANLRFGWLKGMAQTLIGLPQVIAVAIGVSIIPVVAKLNELNELKELRRKVNLVLKITTFIALPCTFGLIFLSKPIIMLLYSSTGDVAIQGTSNILKILSISVLPLMIISIATSVLQGIGRQTIPVVNLAIGGVFKIITTIILTRNPSINVYGAAIGSVIAFTVTMILDLYYVKKIIGFTFDFKVFISLFASIIMGFLAKFSYEIFTKKFGNKVSTIGAILVGIIVYFVILYFSKSITKLELEDLRK